MCVCVCVCVHIRVCMCVHVYIIFLSNELNRTTNLLLQEWIWY